MIQVVIPTMGFCPKEILQYTLEQMEISNCVEKFINIVHESGLCSAIGYKVNAPENKYKLNENGKIAFSDYSYRECVE